MGWTDLPILTINEARRVTINNRTFLVAPVVLIVPGVLAGSKGALLYKPEDIRASVKAWNGVPITLEHPTDPLTNEHLSASHPGVIERQGLGFIDNARWDGRLVALGYFDAQRTRQLAPQVYNALRSGQPVEVSTGLFTSNMPASGSHRGRPYHYIARDFRPDHLATLQMASGACSVKDGCGLNVNAVEGKIIKAAMEWEDVANDANFSSEDQRKFMWSQHPDIAEKWAHGQHVGGKVSRMPAKTGGDVQGPQARAARKAQRKRKKRSATTNRDWPQKKRDKLPKKSFAGPHQSFPIATQEDVDAADKLIGHADDPEAVKARIKVIARRKGLKVPDSWQEPAANQWEDIVRA